MVGTHSSWQDIDYKQLMRRPRSPIPLFIAFALLPCIFGGNSVAQDSPTGPRIKTDPEIFDFGLVQPDVVVSHTFWLRNSGTEEVRITRLQPNCGCTQAPLTDSTIAVGDSVPVEILFGSRNMTGKVEKFTRIFSNASGRVPALTIRTRVVKVEEMSGVFSVTPSSAVLDESNSAKVTLTNTGKSTITLKVVDSPTRYIRIDNIEIALAPEESRELTLLAHVPLPEGPFTKSITLEADDPSRTRITVPVTSVQRE